MSKRTFEAWRSQEMFEVGIGHVVICRHKGSGDTEAGVFLLDTYCLGVKDAFYASFPTSNLGEFLDRVFRGSGRDSLSPACGRKLVEDAIAYARPLGFAPHADYKRAAHVLGGINTRECDKSFTFGRQGKPMYVVGPNDSPEFQHLVMVTLRSRVGEGNYDFLVPAPMGGLEDEESLEIEDLEDDRPKE
jgi:hypothetical protein